MDDLAGDYLLYTIAFITTVFAIVIGTLLFLILQSKRTVGNIAAEQPDPQASKQKDIGAQGDAETEDRDSETENVDDCIVNPDDIEPVTEADPIHPAVVDPLTYSEHIQGKVKQAKAKYITKQIEKKMTPTQIEEEREVQRRQLEAIYNLMKQSEEKFGQSSMDEIDSQFKLYA